MLTCSRHRVKCSSGLLPHNAPTGTDQVLRDHVRMADNLGAVVKPFAVSRALSQSRCPTASSRSSMAAPHTPGRVLTIMIRRERVRYTTRMIRRISITILTATAVLAQNGSRLEGVIQPLAANKMFMGSVLVARGNQVLLSKSYGFANLEWNIPNSPTTKFALASVTKQFTAASILMLEERGKLKT